MKIQKIVTVGDMRDQKRAADAVLFAREDKRQAKEAAERERIAGILKANPQIGELCREGKRVFYVWPAGSAKSQYREARDPAKLAGSAS